MKIYEMPKCSNPNCNEKGWCMYAGNYFCGRCLEKIYKTLEEKKKKEAMEVFG